MRSGNIKKFFFVFFLIFTQFVFAEDKIELVPLINLEELTPTFEEGKDELEKIEDQSSITNKIDKNSNELKSLKSDKIYINLKALDKITAKTSSIRLAVGETKFFGLIRN